MGKDRTVIISTEEQTRIREAARALNTSIGEFTRWALAQACDEVESLGREMARQERMG